MKKFASLFLTAVLILCSIHPLAVVSSGVGESDADTVFSEIMNPGTPQNFNNINLQDPYGYGKGVPFLLSEQNELFFMHNYGDSSSVRIGDTLKAKNSNTGRVMESFNSTVNGTVSDAVKQLSFSKAVSFDPTGSGRRDHVAVLGIDRSKNVVVFFYNTRENIWSSGVTLGQMTWVTDWSYYYMMGEFLSVTAGDYNGDNKETVVVYAAFDGGHGLYEIRMNADRSGQKLNGSVDIGMLNPAYNDLVTPYPGFIDTDDADGNDRMVCVLGTGDIDGDGVDDLAALSHGLGYRYGYFIDHVLPYLSVTLGKKGASGIFQSGLRRTGEYVRDDAKRYDSDENYYPTLRAESMTVVNTDNRFGDDIVIAGKETTYNYYTSDGNYCWVKDGDGLATAKYSWSGDTVARMYYTNQCMEGDSVGNISENGFTSQGIESGGYSTAQVAVQGVYMNGKGNYAYVMVGGDLYDYSDPSVPEKIYDFAFLSSADKGIGSAVINVNFIPAAAAGNFDGNDEGYEQLVMVLGRKQTSTHNSFFSLAMIGIDPAKRNSESGLPTDPDSAFYVTGDSAIETMDASYENNDFGNSLAFVIAAVDNDNDGVLARYNSKDYLYSDPDILVILQESPAFDELYPYSGSGSTSYSISENKTISRRSTVSGSFGVAGSLSLSSTTTFFNVSAGYSLGWSESFQQSVSYTIDESWRAISDDSVIVYRTPWFFYNYDIFNSQTGKWEDNSFSVATENKPSYQQLSVSQYNRFTDYYNNKLNQNTSSFKELTKINALQSHVGLHGNPFLYPDHADTTYGSLQQMAYNGSTSSISSIENTSFANSVDSSRTFTFSLEAALGFKLAGIGAKVGIRTTVNQVIGTSSTESHGKGVSFGGTVASVRENSLLADGYTSAQVHAYGFNWKLGTWNSNIPTGKTDEAGNPLYIPVVGYVLSNVSSLSHPVSDFSVEVMYDSVSNPKGINVTWNDPTEQLKGYPVPAGYNIYTVEDGKYKKAGSVAYGTNEFFFADLKGRTSLGFAVRSYYSSGQTILESLNSGERFCNINKVRSGEGIASIELTARSGNVTTYTVTLNDGSICTYDVNDVTGSASADGGKTVIYINDIAEGDYIIYSALDDRMCLDIDGSKGAVNSGDNLHIWSAGSAAYNVFTLTKDMSTGSYIIKAKHSGLVLDVAGGSKNNGANITQYGSNDTMAQRWILEPADNGYFYIRCIGGGYMDIAGMVGNAVPADGVNVQSWEFTGAKNQQFRLFRLPVASAAATISEGSIPIISCFAGAAAGTIPALIITKKKKKSALAEGTEKVSDGKK